VQITTKIIHDRKGRLVYERRYTCCTRKKENRLPWYDKDAAECRYNAHTHELPVTGELSMVATYRPRTKDRYGKPESRIVFLHDNGRGFRVADALGQSRYTGGLGDCLGLAIYGEGLRKCLSVSVTGKRSYKVRIVFGRNSKVGA